MNYDLTKFPLRLKRTMNREHLRVEDLADRMGISDSSVSSWRYGRTMPHMLNMIVLADALHVSIDYLLGGDKYDD